jgi:hypothetical protein
MFKGQKYILVSFVNLVHKSPTFLKWVLAIMKPLKEV